MKNSNALYFGYSIIIAAAIGACLAAVTPQDIHQPQEIAQEVTQDQLEELQYLRGAIATLDSLSTIHIKEAYMNGSSDGYSDGYIQATDDVIQGHPIDGDLPDSIIEIVQAIYDEDRAHRLNEQYYEE